MLVDVAHDQRCGRSSSAAKKAEALRGIAFARLSSAFSRFNRLSSAASSVLTPGRFPASTWACRHHFLHGLRRPDPDQLRDLDHRRPLRLMITPDLSDHPDRPLTQLGRIPLQRTP
jgi:hypothetical protein